MKTLQEKVMELFTLGRGNYTEDDIKEAARAFTGWSSNLKGEFVFRRFQHDAGSKTVLGKTGNLGGEEVLDILLQQKQTARFITQKIYKYFVNENIDKERVEKLADKFYSDGYDIGKLMEEIFTSEWFYDSKNIGAKIKSPIELMTGIQRMLPMKFQQDEALMLMQRALGQILFYPPNVAGWPGGRTWIDSSTLMLRMRLPQMFDDKDEFNVNPKMDDDQMMGQNMKLNKGFEKGKGNTNVSRPLIVDIDWRIYNRNFESVPRESLLSNINNTLLQVKSQVKPDTIKQFTDNSGRDNFIKTATIQIMSTPEYQLC
jgi:uncharacterized protein (DUF1800 family)